MNNERTISSPSIGVWRVIIIAILIFTAIINAAFSAYLHFYGAFGFEVAGVAVKVNDHFNSVVLFAASALALAFFGGGGADMEPDSSGG